MTNSTRPVGSYAPNGFGLYDMAGNAAELVADGYTFLTKKSEVNPLHDKNSDDRIVRGGCYDDFYCMVWFREPLADLPNERYGFRLVAKKT